MWITPFTEWGGQLMTYEDMNRITGNINELTGANLKADYTQNDFVTLQEWQAILNQLNTLTQSLGMEEVQPTTDLTWENMNRVEGLTQTLKDRIDLIFLQAKATVYAGDGTYASAAPENYVRGV